jgi:hypothetical protein
MFFKSKEEPKKHLADSDECCQKRENSGKHGHQHGEKNQEGHCCGENHNHKHASHGHCHHQH